jgi:uncharacterized membrane protein required for colicin V production
MGVSWVDLILILIICSAAAIGVKRGFGRTFFDFATLLAALYLVSMAYDSASTSIHFTADKTTNSTLVYSLLVTAIGAVCWFIGKLAYDSTLISLEPFETALGAVLGLGVACVCGHAFTKALALMGTVNGKLPDVLANSTLGMEFYDFKTYHSVITFLSSLAQ